MTVEQIDFIGKIAPLAVADMKKNRILASITIAQACVETGFGKSKLMMSFNAPFGVKATDSWLKSGGKAYNSKTGEFINGKNIMVSAAFRAYNSLAEAVEDHANVLKLYHYNKSKGGKVPSDIVGETDYKAAAACLKPYATGADYVKAIAQYIEAYGLEEYDNKLNGVQQSKLGSLTAEPPKSASAGFAVGDKVKIKQSAQFYAGTSTAIPAKYKGVLYVIDGVKSDSVRVKELWSWVYTKDVESAK